MTNSDYNPIITKGSPLWNDRIHFFIEAIYKTNTKVGELPSTLLDTFFPRDTVSSTFSHIITHYEYKGLVERGAVNEKFKTSGLDRIRQTLGNYCNGNDSNDRSYYMKSLVEQCNNFYMENTKESDASPQFAVVMIFFAFLHLTVLRERDCYQEELFGHKNPIYTKDLTSYLETYKAYFNTVCPKWKDWCKEKTRIASHDQNLGLSPKLDSGECKKEQHLTRFLDTEFTKLSTYTSALELLFPPKIHDSPVIVPDSKGPYIFGSYGVEDKKLRDDNGEDLFSKLKKVMKVISLYTIPVDLLLY